MKTIRFYTAKGKSWLSPGAYWAAISTKEKIHAIVHGKGIVFTDALNAAQSRLYNSFKRVIQRGTTSFFLSLALLFVFTWSPVTTRMMFEIGAAIRIIFFLSTLLGLYSVLQGILGIRKIKKWICLLHVQEKCRRSKAISIQATTDPLSLFFLQVF